MVLKVSDDYPILEDSILPKYLRPYCSGKKIQWLERTTEKGAWPRLSIYSQRNLPNRDNDLLRGGHQSSSTK